MNFQDYHSIQSGEMIFTKARGLSGKTAGEHVGTVDHLDGGYVKMKRRDAPDRRHHWFPVNWVDRVEDGIVYLNQTLEDFERGVLDSDPLPRAERKTG